MKVVFFFLLAPFAGAFDIPEGFFDLGELEEAQQKAATADQPLAFVIVEKEATPT